MGPFRLLCTSLTSTSYVAVFASGSFNCSFLLTGSIPQTGNGHSESRRWRKWPTIWASHQWSNALVILETRRDPLNRYIYLWEQNSMLRSKSCSYNDRDNLSLPPVIWDNVMVPLVPISLSQIWNAHLHRCWPIGLLLISAGSVTLHW